MLAPGDIEEVGSSHVVELLPITAYEWSGVSDAGAVLPIVLDDGIDLTPYERADLIVRVHAIDLATDGRAHVVVEAISRTPDAPGVVFNGGDVVTVDIPDPSPALFIGPLPSELPEEVRVLLRLWRTSASASPTATFSIAMRLYAAMDIGDGT